MIIKKRGAQNDSGGMDVQQIFDKLQLCPDIKQKKIYIEDQYEAYFIYIDGMTDQGLLQRDLIRPILAMNLKQISSEVDMSNLPCSDIIFVYNVQSIVDDLMTGRSVFICSVIPFAVSCMLTDLAKRDINEPETEKNVRGAHDGFVEPLQTNLATLRARVSNSALKFKITTIGAHTNQRVAVAYIEGIANQAIVDGLFDKISKINMDGLIGIGYIEQCIVSHPNSIFPQFIATERPDKAVAALLEGRIVVLMNGTPVIFIAPVSFISFIQAPDDYNTNWIQGSFLRMIRIIALFVAIILPSLYVAITSYHYYAVPLALLVPLAESRARVPFPPIVEVLILEITIEMIREAAIRLPTYIGMAISVVAGLIIGQAAVEAGIVSNLLIVIVAATAIASYVIPSYDMAMSIRILRFCYILAVSVFGMIGMVVCTGVTIAHLITLESLGQPYFQPFIPFDLQGLKDTFLRFPLKLLNKRPLAARTKNKIRSREDGRK